MTSNVHSQSGRQIQDTGDNKDGADQIDSEPLAQVRKPRTPVVQKRGGRFDAEIDELKIDSDEEELLTDEAKMRDKAILGLIKSRDSINFWYHDNERHLMNRMLNHQLEYGLVADDCSFILSIFIKMRSTPSVEQRHKMETLQKLCFVYHALDPTTYIDEKATARLQQVIVSMNFQGFNNEEMNFIRDVMDAIKDRGFWNRQVIDNDLIFDRASMSVEKYQLGDRDNQLAAEIANTKKQLKNLDPRNTKQRQTLKDINLIKVEDRGYQWWIFNCKWSEFTIATEDELLGITGNNMSEKAQIKTSKTITEISKAAADSMAAIGSCLGLLISDSRNKYVERAAITIIALSLAIVFFKGYLLNGNWMMGKYKRSCVTYMVIIMYVIQFIIGIILSAIGATSDEG
jgi:hypothetical protein